MKKRLTLWMVLLALWTALFAYLTIQNGAETELTGSTIARWIARVFGGDTAKVHLILRKAAHIISFFVEALLLAQVFRVAGMKRAALWSISICLLLSVGAEAVKLGIEGRHFAWVDVGLNVVGSIVGGGVCSRKG